MFPVLLGACPGMKSLTHMTVVFSFSQTLAFTLQCRGYRGEPLSPNQAALVVFLSFEKLLTCSAKWLTFCNLTNDT